MFTERLGKLLINDKSKSPKSNFAFILLFAACLIAEVSFATNIQSSLSFFQQIKEPHLKKIINGFMLTLHENELSKVPQKWN